MATEIKIQPYTHKQLHQMYEVSWKTLKRWLRPLEDRLGPKNGHFYNSRQVEIIFDYLGVPQKGVEG